jgi:hypothetical protein
MIEFNGLKIAKDGQELKYVMQELERITSQHSKMSSHNFDEETKLAKLKVLIPTDVYKFIAVAAGTCKTYDGLVEMVEAQLMDPLTGLAR